MLALRDPADETNDLGRKFVAFKHAQMTFKRLESELNKDVGMNIKFNLLGNLVGPLYRLEQVLRSRLSVYGRSLIKAGRYHGSLSQNSSANVAAGAVYRPTLDFGQAPDLEQLATTAKQIRQGEIVDEHKARAVKGQDKTEGGGSNVHTWLSEVGDIPDHRETGEAFSNLLGLNNKASKDERKV